MNDNKLTKLYVALFHKEAGIKRNWYKANWMRKKVKKIAYLTMLTRDFEDHEELARQAFIQDKCIQPFEMEHKGALNPKRF